MQDVFINNHLFLLLKWTIGISDFFSVMVPWSHHVNSLFSVWPRGLRAITMDTEGQWSEALASNNIRAIICWLRKLTAEGTLGAFDYHKIIVLSSTCKNHLWILCCLIPSNFISNDTLLQVKLTWRKSYRLSAAGYRGHQSLLKRSY